MQRQNRPAMKALHRFLTLLTAALLSSAALADDRPLQLYLLMGQSNMAGRDTRDLASQVDDPRILALGVDGQWRTARDPIHAKTGRPEPGVGPGIAFAREMLAANPQQRIGLIPTAVGGTPLRRWVKGGDLYEQALAKAREAMTHGELRGVLWHQGESDSADRKNAETHAERLAQTFQDLRADLGRPDLPIVVGQLGEFLLPDKQPEAPTVRAGLQGLPQALSRVGFADSAGLGHLGDDLHFSADANRELGRRFARAMQQLNAAATAAAAASPQSEGRR